MSKVDWDTSHQPDVQPQRYPERAHLRVAACKSSA